MRTFAGKASFLPAAMVLSFAALANAQPKSFAIQLQGVNPAAIATWPADLMILDATVPDGSGRIYDKAEVAAMRGPGRPSKQLLGYLSTGEAETYRAYWKPEWVKQPPSWLDAPNPDWPNNFTVSFWEPEWQRLLMEGPGGSLDRLVEAGFDGVYLDTLDSFYRYEKKRPSARADMVALVVALAQRARARKPGFLVYGNGALELVREAAYLRAISGVVKESTYYRPGCTPNAADSRAYEEGLMTLAVKAGKPALEIDYCDKPEAVRLTRARCASKGFLSYITTVALDKLVPQK